MIAAKDPERDVGRNLRRGGRAAAARGTKTAFSKLTQITRVMVSLCDHIHDAGTHKVRQERGASLFLGPGALSDSARLILRLVEYAVSAGGKNSSSNLGV